MKNNSKKPTAVLVANRGYALFNSRLRLINQLKIEYGYDVIVICERDSYAEKLEDLGYTVIPLSVHRGGGSVVKDVFLLFFLSRQYKKLKPDFIHHFHAKPVIFGTLAARFFSPNSKIINTITGLGYAFTQGGFTKTITELLYRISLRFSSAVIFQNPDDLHYFVTSKFIQQEKTHLIIGSGVDINTYQPMAKLPEKQKITILLASRLLWQKGIKEYIEAANLLATRYPNIEFLLGGEIEKNHPDAIPESYLKEAKNIQFIGYIHDMPNMLSNIEIFVLPSYYREGVPRILLEAAACGIPIICADSPGTREAVIHNKTGLLIPPKNSSALANAIESLVNNKSLLNDMSLEARTVAIKEFDIHSITQKQIRVYGQANIPLTEKPSIP